MTVLAFGILARLEWTERTTFVHFSEVTEIAGVVLIFTQVDGEALAPLGMQPPSGNGVRSLEGVVTVGKGAMVMYRAVRSLPPALMIVDILHRIGAHLGGEVA